MFINLLAVFVAAILLMILGWLWYGPLFGKPWMKFVGMNKESMQNMKTSRMIKCYGLMFISALIMTFVFAQLIVAFQISVVIAAIVMAFWVWLGFIATTQFSGVIWAKKSLAHFCIDAGYYLVGLILISIVLTLWR